MQLSCTVNSQSVPQSPSAAVGWFVLIYRWTEVYWRKSSAVRVYWCGCAVTTFCAVEHLCKYQLYSTSAVLFTVLKLYANMAALGRFCVGEGNIPCATEQEKCCIVLKVGKSLKTNPSDCIRDLIHTVFLAICAIHPLSDTGCSNVKLYVLLVNVIVVPTAPKHYSNTHTQQLPCTQLYCTNTLQ